MRLKMEQERPIAGVLESTTAIVSAYITNNEVGAEGLDPLIRRVYATLNSLAVSPAAEAKFAAQPAIAIQRSITPDYLVCLEDGKKFKSLKRHLRSHYNLSPEEYRKKWELPHDYPMVAPNYAEARSRLAKKMGLGKRRVD
jgi:predicted transcriptional regulator